MMNVRQQGILMVFRAHTMFLWRLHCHQNIKWTVWNGSMANFHCVSETYFVSFLTLTFKKWVRIRNIFKTLILYLEWLSTKAFQTFHIWIDTARKYTITMNMTYKFKSNLVESHFYTWFFVCYIFYSKKNGSKMTRWILSIHPKGGFQFIKIIDKALERKYYSSKTRYSEDWSSTLSNCKRQFTNTCISPEN